MNELHYDLLNDFEYAFKGDMRNASFVTLAAPTVSNMAYVARLKQEFMRAIAGQQANQPSQAAEATPSDDEDMMTGSAIMAMLAMSDIDYASYLGTAKGVFMSPGLAMIDGEEPVKKGTMAKMSIDDLEAMTGEYLKAFILTSVLKMI